jgi:hypothetical protein
VVRVTPVGADGRTVDVLLQHISRSPQRIVLDYIVAVE